MHLATDIFCIYIYKYIYIHKRGQIWHLYLRGKQYSASSFEMSSHLRQIDSTLLRHTHTWVYSHVRIVSLSAASDCIHLHLTPQIRRSICPRVWLHVCCLRRCVSFDLNSYPTAYYRVCRSPGTDCSRLRSLNCSRLQATNCHSSPDIW